MSRSGYCDDYDVWAVIRWRGAVASAIRGRRGQALLRDLLQALDALPEPGLIANELQRDGQYCALGCVAAYRGVPLEELGDVEGYEHETIAATLDVAEALVREIEEINDSVGTWRRGGASAHERWRRVRAWVAEHLRELAGHGADDPR